MTERTIVVTGSEGGIGAATRARLEAEGCTVIGVDMRDAEVLADLGTPEGRAAMVAEVTGRCGGRLDGLAAGAGVSHDDGRLVTAINYFGAVATLGGLRPLLADSPDPAAVAIASNSSTTQPGLPLPLVHRCLAGDEGAALDAAGHGGTVVTMDGGTDAALRADHWPTALPRS